MVFSQVAGDYLEEWDLSTSVYTRTHDGSVLVTRPFTDAEKAWAADVLRAQRTLADSDAARDALLAGVAALTAARDALTADVQTALGLQARADKLAASTALPEAKELAGYVSELAAYRASVDKAMSDVHTALLYIVQVARDRAAGPVGLSGPP